MKLLNSTNNSGVVAAVILPVADCALQVEANCLQPTQPVEHAGSGITTLRPETCACDSHIKGLLFDFCTFCTISSHDRNNVPSSRTMKKVYWQRRKD